MFAILGEIVFELLGSPQGLQSTRGWDYAEHRVVEDRPRLQWIATGLETIELEFGFHASFTDPSAQLAALLAAAEDHNARPLIFANGVHRGYFVVRSVRTVTQQMNASGGLIAVTARATLTEWALDPGSIGGTLPAFPLIGAVPAPPGVTTRTIAYRGGTGVAAIARANGSGFVASPIAAPGVSAMLNLPPAAGPSSPRLAPGDVPPSVIVRAAG